MAADRLIVNGHYEVDPTRALPGYDTPTATAYAVFSPGGKDPSMFGLLCDPKLPLRPDVFRSMRDISEPGMVRAVEWGVIEWPDTGRQHPFLIYDRPAGTKVFETLESQRAPFADDVIINGFLAPAAAALEALSERERTHRAIRPNNLYFADTGQRTLMLGEAASAPPGFSQPDLFEPIELAGADKAARGEGTLADDLFALGITVLCLLLGRVPPTAEDPDAVLLERMVGTSYSAAVRGNRLQMNMVELLRGLLSDDVAVRWNLRVLESWIGGRQMTPKQAKPPVRATRPLTVAGTDHEIPRAAAHGLSVNWADAGKVCRSADFDSWLQRSLDDDEISANVREAVGPSQAFQDMPPADDDKLVTSLCIALDRVSPIRHRGFGTHMEGVGTALATYFDDEERLRQVRDVIIGRFVNTWMALQPRSRPELLHLYGVFESLPGFIEHNEWSEGIERCLYELNPFYHCRSPYLEQLMAYRIEDVLAGLNRVAAECDQTQLPIDRHIAAFIVARTPKIEGRMLRSLGAFETSRAEAVISCLTVLAQLQKDLKVEPLPELSLWFAALLQPAIEKFHNIKRRAEIAADIEKIADTGDLTDLLHLVDDPEALSEDERRFKVACHEYHLCTVKIGKIQAVLRSRGLLSYDVGEQAAAIVAGIISSVGASTILIWSIL